MSRNVCPKCNSDVENNQIRCSKCSMRLKQVCPECGSLNDFGIENCLNCGTVLIKYCENCGSANLPNASVCRKCNQSLEKPVLTFQKHRGDDKTEIGIVEEDNNNIPVENTPVQEEITVESDNNEDIIELNEVPEKSENENEIIEEQEDELTYENPPETLVDGDVASVEAGEEPTENIETEIEDEFENTVDSVNEVEGLVKPVSEVKSPELLIDNEEFDIDSSNVSEDEEIFDYSDAQDLLNRLVQVIDQPNKKVVAVCGEEGMGKTTIINALLNSLSQKQILGIHSECSELTKIAPFGCIRNSLLRLLSLPDFHPDMPSYFGEQSKKLFASNFENLTPQEVLDFMNFLYPSLAGNYKDLYNNKIKTYTILEKVIKSITSKNNVIFIIDNFDLIDTSSYDFVNYLIKNNKINNKLIVTYQEHKSAKYYFDETIADTSIFETLSIVNMNETQASKLVQNFVNTENIPEEVLNVINTNGKGNIFFTEQFLALLFDVGYISVNQNIMSFNNQMPLPFSPQSLEELIKDRLNTIKINELKECLYTASVLGYRFDSNIFGEVMEYTPEQTQEVLKKLSELMYLYQSGNYEFSFKNMTSWNVIFDEAQTIPNFKPICKKIYYIMGKYGLSNVTIKASVAKQRDEAETAFQSWKVAADTAAYLGDEYIYTTCCEQWLAASGYSETSEQITDAQIEVLESLGKLYSFDRPEIAVKYLTQPVLYSQKQGNIPKLIELSAYMIKACEVIDNYNGIVETVDMVVSSSVNLQPLEKTIILSKKMKSLFVLGNCEEAINLANNDLLPVLEAELSKNNNPEQMEKLFEIWFDISINLANTYSLQGNTQSLAIIANIDETLKMNNIKNEEYSIRLSLSKAFAQTIMGCTSDCFDTLNNISPVVLGKNKLYKSQYNLILSLAKIMSEDIDDLKQKLFEFAKFSDDNFDKFGKHMFKLIFATLLFLSGDFAKSIEIFNDELNFFAKEKIVTGALLSWLFISRINLLTRNPESAENVAIKALEVAQNPKFSQYHISIYLQKLIAEVNIAKGDFDAAKMYIEKGMLIAKQFGLELAKIELYNSYIKLLEQVFVKPESDKNDTINKINQLYKSSLVSLQKLNSPVLTAKVQMAYSGFVNYCQQNSLQLT